MNKNNTVVANGNNGVNVDGLQAALALAEKRAESAAVKDAKGRDKRIAKLTEMRDLRNPQIRVETLRATFEGELINGKPAKGWCVSIECETCAKLREVNTQDAFQVRFCGAACKPKKGGTVTGSKEARELLKSHSVEELRAMLEAAKSAVA